jgi:archaellum component FlaC
VLKNLEHVVTQVSNNQNGLIQAFQEQKNSNDATVRDVERLVERLEKTSQNYDAYSKQFVNVYEAANKQLQGLSGNLDALSRNLNNFVTTLKSDSLSSTSTINANMNVLVKELHALNNALSKSWLRRLLGI